MRFGVTIHPARIGGGSKLPIGAYKTGQEVRLSYDGDMTSVIAKLSSGKGLIRNRSTASSIHSTRTTSCLVRTKSSVKTNRWELVCGIGETISTLHRFRSGRKYFSRRAFISHEMTGVTNLLRVHLKKRDQHLLSAGPSYKGTLALQGIKVHGIQVPYSQDWSLAIHSRSREFSSQKAENTDSSYR
jgi:hypothetical protein